MLVRVSSILSAGVRFLHKGDDILDFAQKRWHMHMGTSTSTYITMWVWCCWRSFFFRRPTKLVGAPLAWRLPFFTHRVVGLKDGYRLPLKLVEGASRLMMLMFCFVVPLFCDLCFLFCRALRVSPGWRFTAGLQFSGLGVTAPHRQGQKFMTWGAYFFIFAHFWTFKSARNNFGH